MGAVEACLVGLAVAITKLAVQQLAEKGQRTAAGNARFGEVFGSRKVGRSFLRTGEGEEFAHRRLLAERHDPRRSFSRARQCRADAGQHGKQRNLGSSADPFAVANDVPTGDMAELMRNDALDFFGAVGGLDQAAMNIDCLPARNEGVDGGIIDQNDVDIRRLQPGSFDQRFGYFVEELLGFRIAQHALCGDRLRGQHGGGENCEQAGEKAHNPVLRPRGLNRN